MTWLPLNVYTDALAADLFFIIIITTFSDKCGDEV